MKKLAFAVVLIILLAMSVHSDDKYVFICNEPNGTAWWLDTYSIDTKDDIVMYWVSLIVSPSYRQELLNNVEKFDVNTFQKIRSISKILLQQDVKTDRRIFRNSQMVFLDSNGTVLERKHDKNWYSLSSLLPVNNVLAWIKNNYVQARRNMSMEEYIQGMIDGSILYYIPGYSELDILTLLFIFIIIAMIMSFILFPTRAMTQNFLSRITFIEKICLCIIAVNITLGLFMLTGVLSSFDYFSVQQIRNIITSSFGVLCAWFSVRYSFYLAKKVQDKALAIFIRCAGVFISVFIFWARGYGLF